jgi:hypothetical protein
VKGMSSSKSDSGTASRTSDEAAKAHDEYMAQFSQLFAEELFAVHSSDASPETLKNLSSCIEAGLMVWRHPLHIPSERQY